MVSAMLGIVRLGGVFKTSDWLVTSALFAFALPLGIHVSIFAVLLGFASSVLHHAVVCLGANLRRDPFPDVQSMRGTKILAMICCKKRQATDRFAYPAVSTNDGVLTFDINSGVRAKSIDYTKKCPYVIPSIPIITHMLASFLIVSVLFLQNIIHETT